jgi:hypothetical protein
MLKALALDTRTVVIDRPILYELACGGQNNVKKALELLKRELVHDYGLLRINIIYIESNSNMLILNKNERNRRFPCL